MNLLEVLALVRKSVDVQPVAVIAVLTRISVHPTHHIQLNLVPPGQSELSHIPTRGAGVEHAALATWTIA